RPNDMLHLDYIKIYTSYLLVVCDDFSRKTELYHTYSANSETTVNALLFWRARYGFNDRTLIMSDNGSHFAGVLVKDLEKSLSFTHRFSVTFSPWTNGSIESQNVQLLKGLRSLVSEYRMRDEDWPSLIPLIQCMLNN